VFLPLIHLKLSRAMPPGEEAYGSFILYSLSIHLHAKCCFPVSELFCSICKCMDSVLFMYFHDYSELGFSFTLFKLHPKEIATFVHDH
jgi:hypothetical protein